MKIMNPYIIIGIVLWLYLSIVWLIAQIIKNNSIIDIVYGSTYVVASIFALIFGAPIDFRSILLVILVSIWGMRLSIYIFIRNHGQPEDFRYQEFRKNWGTHQALFAYFKVFILQGAIVYIICFPILYTNFTDGPTFQITDIIGTAIWILGFFFESLGDAQLRNFKKDPSNKGRVMNQGLWRYTRHPNYFGEATMWWGIYVIVSSIPNGIWMFFSPLLITTLLLKVSGVSLLEKKYKGSPEYIDYQKSTSSFIPWFPKKI
jgi:steroid 5-alpha reductase family enzyme